MSLLPSLMMALQFVGAPDSSRGACLVTTLGIDSARASLRSASLVGRPSVQRDAMAMALLACLESPDPVIRDEMAFSTLQTWMRSAAVSDDAVRAIARRLLPLLSSQNADSEGFRQPFAALTLAEVARVDRLTPVLDQALRLRLRRAALDYLRSIQDYRALDSLAGWRHGIAHGADLLLQLSLASSADSAFHRQVLAAVGSQVVPRSDQPYRFGEQSRLVRPVLAVVERGDVPDIEWQAWLEQLTDPAPFREWSTATMSIVAWHRASHVRSFLQQLFVDLERLSDAPAAARLLPLLARAIETLP